MANGNDVATQTQSAGMDTLSAQAPPEVLQQQIPSMTQTPTSAPSNEEIPPYKPYTPPAAPATRPGTFGWKIAQALQGFTKAMGDAGNVGQVPEGGGALYGIAKTLQARNQRQREEQAHQDEQTQRAKENAREDWKTMAEVARSNSQMRHEQLLTFQLGSEAMDKSISAGQQMVDQWSSLPKAQSEVKGENLTAAELNNMIKSKKLDPTKVTAFPTGKKFITEDKNGNPQYAMTYTIMSVPAEYQLSAADKPWIDVVNKIPGANQYNVGTEGKNDGDRMPGYVANSLFKQSQTIQAQTAATIKAAADLKLTNEYNTFAPTGDWTMFLGAQKGDIADAEKHMLADPEMRQKYPNLHQDIVRSFATKEDPTGQSGYTTALDKQQKDKEAAFRDADRMRHELVMEQVANKNAATKAAVAKGAVGDVDKLESFIEVPSDTNRLAYWQTVPADKKLQVAQIGFGILPLTNPGYMVARDKGGALGTVTAMFGPEWENYNTKAFVDMNDGFAKGKDGQTLVAANTALQHLHDLGTTVNQDDVVSRFPWAKSYAERNSIKNMLIGEMAKWQAGGNAPSNVELDHAEQTLGQAGVFSMNRADAIRTTNNLISQGLNSLETKWQDTAPPSFRYDMPYKLSPESEASFLLTRDAGKVMVKDPQGRSVPVTDANRLASFIKVKRQKDQKDLFAQRQADMTEFFRTGRIPSQQPGQPGPDSKFYGMFTKLE